jgi:hypothetical protein
MMMIRMMTDTTAGGSTAGSLVWIWSDGLFIQTTTVSFFQMLRQRTSGVCIK